MKSNVNALVVVLSIGVVAVVGCAEGADLDPEMGYLASNPLDAGFEEDGESVKLPPSNPSTPPDETIDEGGPDDIVDAGGGGGADAGTDAGGGNEEPEPTSCAASSSCTGALNLGAVSGDTGADTISTEGFTSHWLRVRVTENDGGLTGVPLWLSARLVSPPGTNFDLYVYVPATDTIECSAVTNRSTSTSSTDTVSVSFGETGLFSNGAADDRTVTVEVRHVSGNCDASQKWKLELFGNK